MGDIDQIRQSLPYRQCVGAMVLNESNHVFVGKRASNFAPIIEHPWQMPQGGLDEMEAPLEGALRELYEETSIRSVVMIDQTPSWLTYDLPDELLGSALKGKFRGQKQLWFVMRFTGYDSEINVTNPGNGKFKAEFESWKWVPMDELVGLIVPFKRDVYRQIVKQFSHLA